MCKRVQCERCEKLTYSGCGRHLDQVFRGVSESERCRCAELLAAVPAAAIVAQAALSSMVARS